MPLEREMDYWEHVADRALPNGHLIDNSWKRPHQLRRLLKYTWIDEKVLEVGTGNGIVAGSMRLLVGGHWEYLGTELASRFRHSAANMFFLNTVEADVREIPGAGYTRIIAFDSLEHVRPEHRQEGYERIHSAAADDALLFIHYSYSQSHHDKEFDHPFGLSDLLDIEKTGFSLIEYDRYEVDHPKAGTLDYAFVVMRKRGQG